MPDERAWTLRFSRKTDTEFTWLRRLSNKVGVDTEGRPATIRTDTSQWHLSFRSITCVKARSPCLPSFSSVFFVEADEQQQHLQWWLEQTAEETKMLLVDRPPARSSAKSTGHAPHEVTVSADGRFALCRQLRRPNTGRQAGPLN